MDVAGLVDSVDIVDIMYIVDIQLPGRGRGTR